MRRWTVALCLVVLVPAPAQERPVGPPLPIIVHHADAFLGRHSDSGEVQELVGNVWLQHGNAIVHCGAAVHYLASGLVLLRQNVRIEQGDLQISAPSIVYDPAAGTALAEHGVDIRQGQRRITARWGIYEILQRRLLFRTAVRYQDDTLALWTDTLRYERSTGAAYAWGGVYAESPSERLAAEADTLDYQPSNGLLLLSGSVLLQQWDPDSTRGSLWLSARRVLLRRREEPSLQASDSVELLRDTLWAARAESLQRYTSPERFFLYGSPLVWYTTAELTAETVEARRAAGQLQQLVCTGQARLRLATGIPERFHQLRADTITVVRQEDSLTELIASGNARSLYCHRAADGAPEGLFRHGADRIELSFSGDSLQSARWLGAVYGEFIPEPLVADRFREWSLPGMLWRAERPQLRSWRHRPRWLP